MHWELCIKYLQATYTWRTRTLITLCLGVGPIIKPPHRFWKHSNCLKSQIGNTSQSFQIRNIQTALWLVQQLYATFVTNDLGSIKWHMVSFAQHHLHIPKIPGDRRQELKPVFPPGPSFFFFKHRREGYTFRCTKIGFQKPNILNSEIKIRKDLNINVRRG